MNWKSPSAIIFYCVTFLSILCLCLTNVANFFCIIGSSCLVLSFSMLTFWSFTNYIKYKGKIEDKRLSDAYIYAEKMGNEEAIKDFSYSRSQERKLRYDKYNHFIVPVTFLLLTIVAIFLFLICTKII